MKKATAGEREIVSLVVVFLFFLSTVTVCAGIPASPITQQKFFSGVPSLSRTLTFNQFDDLGGTRTLQSVKVTFSMDTDGGVLILDNDGQNPANGSFQFGAKGGISSTDVSLLNAAFQPVTAQLLANHSDSFSLAANVGDGAGDYSPIEPDGMQYNGGAENDSDSGFINSLVFAGYKGTGTYDIVVDATQWQNFGGVSGIEWAVTPVSASGYVQVDYNFIPEPTTIALLSLGGLLLRKRKA